MIFLNIIHSAASSVAEYARIYLWSNGAGDCLCKKCIHPPFAIKGHRFLPTEKKSKLMFELKIVKMFL